MMTFIISRERKEIKKPFAPQTFGELFKKQVVKEFEQRLFTKAKLRRHYNIHGNIRIPRWFKKIS